MPRGGLPARWRELAVPGLFGLIDGLNGMVGLVIGLSHSRVRHELIFIALLARAGSSAVSMAGAQYQAGSDGKDPRARWGGIAAMGLGYLTSALLPGLGFAVSSRLGWTVFIPATVIILTGIAWFRESAPGVGWARAVLTTLLIFGLAVGAGLLASLAG